MSDEEYGSFDDEEVEEAITLAAVTPARLMLRQRTLFGGAVAVSTSPGAASYSANRVRQRNRNEPATHHYLDPEAIKTWVFPTNYAQRDYQFNMIRKALFTNVLVALPTGLGKTFIAAVVMYNWYRWAPKSKIIFLAPAKPLVTQQIEACYHVCGIPAAQTAELTGGIDKGRRMAAYEERRVFFLTPQTFQNDLRNGLIKAKDVSCLVVDEAHHATGNYAYVNVVRMMREESESFRVLALTATPGKTVETVQEVIDGLNISQIEIRNESSIDIRAFTHTKEIETILIDLSPEMVSIQSKYASLLKPMMQRLASMGVGMTGDPTKLSAFGIREAVGKLQRESRGGNGGNANAARAIGGILSSLAYNMELLNTHGVRPFYDAMVELKTGVKSSENKKRVIQNANFGAMMREMEELMQDPEYTGHPKLDHLSGLILNHFQRAEEEGNTKTRVMIFSSLRVSSEAIVAVLKRQAPLVKPTPFFGQAVGKSGSGMSQKEQQETITKFKKGVYNVIVATSVGEEGLDIGEIDMIICYDSSSSPARMLQRMGRTGRKRDGQVFVLCVRGKEEMAFIKAKDAHKTMQKKIEKGIDIKLSETVHRILPWNVNPECEKRQLEVPVGDKVGDRELKTARQRKKEAKVFSMPDGVATGFVTAGGLTLHRGTKRKHAAIQKYRLDDKLWDYSDSGAVPLLSHEEERELALRFRTIDEDHEGCLRSQRAEQGRFLSRAEVRDIARPVRVSHGQTIRTLKDLLHKRFKATNLAAQISSFTSIVASGTPLGNSDLASLIDEDEVQSLEDIAVLDPIRESEDEEVDLDEDKGLHVSDSDSYGQLGSFIDDDDDDGDGAGFGQVVQSSMDDPRLSNNQEPGPHRVTHRSPPRLPPLTGSIVPRRRRRPDPPPTQGIFSEDSDGGLASELDDAGPGPGPGPKRVRLSQLARDSDEDELPDTRDALKSAITASSRKVLNKRSSVTAAPQDAIRPVRGQRKSKIRIVESEEEDADDDDDY
ncbi:ATP-dependent DNA helicase MPH1 [Taphrina deformans PYCC 5710]|uniref:ATP-dependent DNA helicase n=1 Tax=Taphrina deformans (strain PYCC 5710 / ATCC 11124 / CBS 356.35 / IMI 108563 / JCM 9778 / NBRC 8474) TaxID=1097556 RepID=R4XDU5_TAPDE|nr:ATP-dependent DNA helicase MPH1 [Taphrina deformans PYCC 5710]|eukprot:CCG82590.1 ATP-dependent DNA helicase MPH1 [Taphrina deformans PYCC 5710]